MDAVDWLGLIPLVAALILLLLAMAAETSVLAASRIRARLLAGKGQTHAEVLQRYLRQRQALTQALSLARSLAVIGASVIGAYLIMVGLGHTWGAVAVAFGAGLLVAALLQSISRLLVLTNPERWGLRLAPFLWLSTVLLAAPARLLELPARLILRSEPAHEEGESEAEPLHELVEMEELAGVIEKDERRMIEGVIRLAGTTVREIMVPRTDIVAVDGDASIHDVVNVIVQHGFSRVPLYQESLDNIIGVVYAKDLLQHLENGRRPIDLAALARRPLFIPESKKAGELLAELQRSKVHMAIVVDEYGGTAGLVTIEDLLEEIVGEIRDEYDVAEVEPVEQLSEDEAIVDARLGIDALNEMFGLAIEGKDFDTVGGFVYTHLGKMPSVGDEVHIDGICVRVLSVVGRRIKKVHIQRRPAEQEPHAASPDQDA